VATVTIKTEPAGYIIGSTSRIVRFLQKCQLPVFALGSERIHHFVLHGQGFTLPLENEEKSLIGFYVNVWVAAPGLREARERAVARVREFWSDFGYETNAGGQPAIEVAESSVLRDRIRRRWRTGFAFYSEE